MPEPALPEGLDSAVQGDFRPFAEDRQEEMHGLQWLRHGEEGLMPRWELFSWAGILFFVIIVVWITGMMAGLWVFRPFHEMSERWKQRKEQD